MSVNNTDAQALVDSWVSDQSLRSHLSDVSVVMRSAAKTLGDPVADADVWEMAGFLHDADWQRDPENHPRLIVEWLRERGEDEIAEAVRTHNTAWGQPTTRMAACLLAFDELTGFVGAVAKVNPNGLSGVTVSGVVKKLKRPSFAASVERSEIVAGSAAVGLSVEDAIAFVLTALTGTESAG
jgi:predicted hydrolase (HD superfamily)